MAYHLRQIDESMYHHLPSLFFESFGWNPGLAFFTWKYEANPIGKALTVAAFDEHNNLVAFCAFVPRLYQVQGKERTVFEASDAMTFAAHRGNGLFQKIINYAADYFREKNNLFLLAYGASTDSAPLFLKLGWEKIADGDFLIYPFFFALKYLFLSKKTPRVSTIQDIELIAPLLIQSNNGTGIHEVKSREAFRWRIQNPTHEYKLYAIVEKGVALGYLCFFKSKKRIYLFDFFAVNKKIEEELVCFLKKQLINRPFQFGIMCLCTKTSWLYQQLLRHGFVKSPFKKGKFKLSNPILIFGDKEVLDKYANPQLWNLASFEHDTI